VLGTDAFLALARSAAVSLGRPQLAVATIEHPIGGIDPGLVRSRADKLVDDVLAALTTDLPVLEPSAVRAAPALEAPEDLQAFQTFALAEGWSDGLPVIPPTPERVERLLAGRSGRSGEAIATLAPSNARATAETIAVNAVLAGAGPEHFAVIVAAVRAVADPRFNLFAVQTTTHPCTPLVIVNGPIARRLDINGGPNALGQGHRANAVIGRALRLVLQNIGGARPGSTDRATLGHPGKYTYCLSENEAASPWPSLHVERGFTPETSCVTVCGADAPHNVNDHGSTTAEALLLAFAGTLATPGNNNVYLGGEPLVVLGPEHAQTFAHSGWTKDDIKRALWERAQVPIARFSAENLTRFAIIDPARFADHSADLALPPAARAEDLVVVVAGGPGKHSAVIPTFGATRSVTRAVEA
jgi:hypothetical protein